MRREILLILGAYTSILAVALLVPLLRLAPGHPARANEANEPRTVPNDSSALHVKQIRGISLQLHNDDPGCPFEQYVEEIADTGANTICLGVAAQQEHAGSSVIYLDRRHAPSDERLTSILRLARGRDLRVVLMPMVLLSKPRGSEWRGQINPDDWDEWWRGYRRFILHYAPIAQREGVEVFMVGSELITTEKPAHEQQWRELIADVRHACDDVLDRQFREHLRQLHPEWSALDFRRELGIDDLDDLRASEAIREGIASDSLRALYDAFAGPRRMRLSYSANWDHYTVPPWWDDLDIVGMTSYHNLNVLREPDPAVEDLKAALIPIKQSIEAWRRTVGKPVLFTEVGWPSQDGCSIEPWNYFHSKQVDLAEQDNCMRAFLETFGHEPWVAGVLIWKWRDHPNANGGENDLGYTPYRKPVMKTIEEYFASPDPRAETTTPAVSKTTAKYVETDTQEMN